jgi:hypothetical protein
MLREDIILKLEELETQTKTYKKLLQVWDKSGLELWNIYRQETRYAEI